MRSIFFIYWVWYIAYLTTSMLDITFSIDVARIIGMSSILTFYFVCVAPIYYIIYHKKGHRKDQSYLNACLHSAIIRCVIWVFAYYGISDHKIILALNGFGMLVFILIESKLKQIDKSYFNF